MNSGYNLDWMFVRQIHLEDENPVVESLAGHAFPVQLQIDVLLHDSQQSCRIALTVSCHNSPPADPDSAWLRLRTEAQFTVVGAPIVPISQFAQMQGPVIMLPFVREHLASISARTRFGQVLLNPLNMQAALTPASTPTVGRTARERD